MRVSPAVSGTTVKSFRILRVANNFYFVIKMYKLHQSIFKMPCISSQLSISRCVCVYKYVRKHHNFCYSKLAFLHTYCFDLYYTVFEKLAAVSCTSSSSTVGGFLIDTAKNVFVKLYYIRNHRSRF